jgi:helicase MOV-10
MQAVESIVNDTAYPSPYIIFGPPGTGKTSTIVETICQLYRMVPASRILVTAQSNSACDELSARLLQALPSGDMYRIYAPYILRKMERIDPELQAISNVKAGTFGYPSWDELYAKRIVVCTLTTAGRLVLARVNKRHFTHVFIDECASATEPAALVPIVGVITGKNRIYGNIVLAGDIQQLGPTLKSRFAFRLGYGKHKCVQFKMASK